MEIGADDSAEHISLSDTLISSNATASNLLGAGRTIGLLYDASGRSLERFIGRIAVGHRRTHHKRHKKSVFNTPTDISVQLDKDDDTFSAYSTSTNETAPNLPGAGHTIGLLYDSLGLILERLLNRIAVKRGLGPKAVSDRIRDNRYHRSYTATHELRVLVKDCRSLVKYATK